MNILVVKRPHTIPEGRTRHTAAHARAAVQAQESAWGWLPALSLVGALGLLTIAVADLATGAGLQSGYTIFWAGLALFFIPAAARACSGSASRFERIGLILMLGLGLYLVKVLRAPADVVFTDEFAHWRTAADIAQSGHLLHPNSLLPISALYPGLEIATTALAALSGLSIYGAGAIIIGAARLLLVLSLFFIFEQVSGSARIAAVASVFYTANPNFTFWSAQFSYESLSLPMAVFIMYLAVRRTRERSPSLGLVVLLALTFAAVVATHHLTAYILTAFFAVWSLVTVLLRRFGGRVRVPAPVAMVPVMLAATLAWLLIVAPLTIGYLVPVLSNAFAGFVQLLSGAQGVKQFFRGDPALSPPPWEQALAAVAVVALVGVLLLALVMLWRSHRRWPRYRTNALALTFVLTALAYPASLALRLTSGGTETSNRSSEYLFIAVGFVLAVAFVNLVLARPGMLRLGLVTAFALLIFSGGVIIGLARWARMPGPYVVAGDTRAIQPESVEAAHWMLRVLGPGNGVIADSANEVLMGSYGLQRMLHGESWIYFSPVLGVSQLTSLQRSGTEYVVVDKRLSQSLPATGFYFERGEPEGGAHKDPLSTAVLGKFDNRAVTRRVFDSGNIVIYDMNFSTPIQ